MKYLAPVVVTCMLASGILNAEEAPPTPAVHVSAAEVTIYNSSFRPAFWASGEFVRELIAAEGGPPEQRGGFLRLTGEGRKTLWLACTDVVATVCENAPVSSPKPNLPGIVTRAQGIPLCPGDPRCPVSKKRGT